MWKALKRSGWLFIATGILALAYYIGNQTAPSVPNETTPYDPASDASAKRQASASPAPKPHAILSLSPALPQAKAPVPTVRKRRPLTDEEVAWHVIDNPGSTSPKDIPATAQLFSQEPKVAP